VFLSSALSGERIENRGPIPLDEWLAYVSSDEEIDVTGEAIVKGPKGETIKRDAPGMTERVDTHTGSHACFDPHCKTARGSVVDPSQETLGKMVKVAKAYLSKWAIGGCVSTHSPSSALFTNLQRTL